MAKQLKLREQIMFVRNLGALIGAGLPMETSLRQLARLIPRQRVKLEEMSKQVGSGRYLSHVCDELLPEELIAAIAVGEQSGRMVGVLEEIKDTLILKERMGKTIGQLGKPLMMLLIGIIVFVGFVCGVIPVLHETSSKLSRGSEPGGLMGFMVSLSDIFINNGVFILSAIVVAVVALIVFARTESGRITLYGVAVKIPLIGSVLTNISFALWARYLALMWRAGYASMPAAIGITRKSVPPYFWPGITLYQKEVELGRGLGAACDPDRLAPGDPRLEWPIFLQVALQISEKTMATDEQLSTASVYLLEDAETTVGKIMDVAKIVVLVVVAASAALPLVAYMFEVVTMVSGTLGRLR